MVEFNSEEIEKSSGSWNVAEGYTRLKILKPLVEMDDLVRVAIYGSEKLEDELNLMQYPEIITMRRINAIRRLIDVLREVIENARFALKANEKPVLDRMERRVLDVSEVLSAISSENIDMRNENRRTIVINEEHFAICLDELREIKKEIPEPLNKASLIFRASDEINLDEIKKQIIEGG